jgi:hypothetical protein
MAKNALELVADGPLEKLKDLWIQRVCFCEEERKYNER